MACAVLGGLVGTLVPGLAYRLCGAAPCSGGPLKPRPPGWLWVPLGALAFGGLGWALGPVLLLGAALPVAAAGLALAATDLACLRLPDPLVGAAFLVTAAVLGTASIAAHDAGPLLRCGVAGLGCAAAYCVAVAVPRTGLGLGDAKLAGLLGFLLGWLGWPAVLLGLALPYACNGPVVLGLLLTGRVRRDTPLPFGPALLAGAYLAILLVR
jgi:leader peptidase (prepilin peptidase)/N-methyltransferase